MRSSVLPTSRLKTLFLFIFSILLLFYFLQYNDPSHLPIPNSFHITLDNTTQYISDTTLQSYEAWHFSQRICLHEKTCKPPLLIWQCPGHSFSQCAGLGDRMRGIQFAFLLAIATRRVFLIDWPSNPFPLETVLHPARIDWTMPSTHRLSHSADLFLDWHPCIKSILCLKPINRFPDYHKLPIRNGSISRSAFAAVSPRPTVDLHRDDLREIWALYNVVRIAESMLVNYIQILLRNEYLQPHLDSLTQHSLLNVQRLLTQTLFKPSKPVQRRMRKFSLTQTPYIGLHIRNGKDYGEKGHRFDTFKKNENRTVVHILKCITSLVSNQSASFDQFSRKNLHLYLASDSKNMKALFRKHGKQFKVRVHMMSEKTMHIARMRRKQPLPNLVRRQRAFRNVFVDMLMLSRSSVLLGTGSGYSNTSWAFGNSTAYFQVAVDKKKESEDCMLTQIWEEEEEER